METKQGPEEVRPGTEKVPPAYSFAALRDALEYGTLGQNDFCRYWRESAAQSYQMGNLIALRLLLQLMEKAPAMQSKLGQLLFNEYNGLILMLEGNFDKAAYYFQQQQRLAQALVDLLEIVRANINLAQNGLYEFQLKAVEGWLQEATQLAELSGNQQLIIQCLNWRAELDAYRHLTDQCIEKASLAVSLARYYKLPSEEADALDCLGSSLIYRREWAQSEQALLAAIRLHRDTRNAVGRARSLSNLSRLYIKRGSFELASNTLDGSLAIFSQLKARPALAEVYLHKATLLYRSGHFNEALDWARQSLEIRLELGEPTRLAEAFSLVAQIYAGLGQEKYALMGHLRVLELYYPGVYNLQWIKPLTEASDYLIYMRDNDPQENTRNWQQALAGYRAAIDIIELHKDLRYLAPLLGRIASALLKLEGMEGINEAMRCYRLQLNLLGDMGLLEFEPGEAIAMRAQALNRLQICASLRRRM